MQFLAPEAGEDDDGFDVSGVHGFDHVGGRNFFAVDAGGIVDVIVHVDDWEAGARGFVLGDVQHGVRVEVFEEQGHALGGVGVLFIDDVLLGDGQSGHRQQNGQSAE